jgi:hypothetical protein
VRLRLFAITYTATTLFFFGNIYSDQSSSIGYLYFFPFFWIIGAIILGGLFYWRKIKLETKWDWVTLTLATPIPTMLFLFIGSTMRENVSSIYEFNKDGHRHKIVTYSYKNGKDKRIEIYKSEGIVTPEHQFIPDDNWLKDSIWVYYNKDGTIEKTENYASR